MRCQADFRFHFMAHGAFFYADACQLAKHRCDFVSQANAVQPESNVMDTGSPKVAELNDECPALSMCGLSENACLLCT